MSNKLKPCPFCGVTPDEDSHYTNQGTKWGGILCCIEGPEVRTSYKAWPFFKQDAIDAWNDRKEPIQWQPIETWVDDGGTPLLIAFRNKEVAIAPWSKSGPMEVTPQFDLGWTATHWMPLPAPPENKP